MIQRKIKMEKEKERAREMEMRAAREILEKMKMFNMEVE